MRLCTSSDRSSPLSYMAMKQQILSRNTSSLSVDSMRLRMLPASSSWPHSAICLLNFQDVRHKDAKRPIIGTIVSKYRSAGLSTDNNIIRLRKERKPDSETRKFLLIAGPCRPATESMIAIHVPIVILNISFRFFVTRPFSVLPTSYAVVLTTVWYIWRHSWNIISK